MYLTFQKSSTSTANLEREDVTFNLIFSIEGNLSCIQHFVVLISVASVQIFLFSVFSEADVVSMADSTITVGDIEGELYKIDRLRDILIRRESELRYM